jgi:hypothetical protein
MSERRKYQARCASCDHFMVPRVVFRGGEPSHAICPFCGTAGKSFVSNEDAFAFGTALGRLWKMKPVEKGFVDSLVHGGLSTASAQRMFKVFKAALLFGIAYLIS